MTYQEEGSPRPTSPYISAPLDSIEAHLIMKRAFDEAWPNLKPRARRLLEERPSAPTDEQVRSRLRRGDARDTLHGMLYGCGPRREDS